MAEFTDTANAADNTGFSDSLGDAMTSTPQGIPDSTVTPNTGDSSPAPPDTTGTDTVTTGDTATPHSRRAGHLHPVTTVTNRTAGIPDTGLRNRSDSYRAGKEHAFVFGFNNRSDRFPVWSGSCPFRLAQILIKFRSHSSSHV